MEYTARSIMVSRNKDRRKGTTAEFPYFVMIKLFDVNDPHKTTELPKETLEFTRIKDVVFRNHGVKYLPLGSDIVLNDLRKVVIRKSKGQVIVE